MLVRFVDHVHFVRAPFNARDDNDQQRDKEKDFVKRDSERDGNRK